MSCNIELISRRRPHDFIDNWYQLSREGHFWFYWRFAATLQMLSAVGLPLNKPLRALEIGCGTGVLRRQFETATNWFVDATDLNYEALAKMQTGRGRILYYDVLEQKEQFRKAYDVVILFDVLEHIGDSHAFLKAAAAHLKPSGVLLVNVPAMPSMFSKYDEAAGHLRRYNKRTLSNAFADSGLMTTSLRYWGLTLLPFLLLRKLSHHVRSQESPAAIIRSGFHVNRTTNYCLRKLAEIENGILRSLPLGSSLLAIAKLADQR